MFKQPRVPQMRAGMNLAEYVRELVLFLKDFSMDAWAQSKRHADEIERLKDEIERLKQGGG